MSTKIIVLPEEAFNTIIEKFETIQASLWEKQQPTKTTWLDNQEFMQHLKISRRTAQSYRDNNMIAFSIIGNKVYYRTSDVENLLNRHYHKRLQ